MNLHILVKSRKSSATEFSIPYVTVKSNINEPIDVIRWGTTKTGRNINEVLQPRNGIILAADKLLCRKTLLENEIPCPQIYTERSFSYPLIARKQKHRMGSYFYFVENEKDLEFAKRKGAIYWQEYIEKDSEYRVHVFLNKVLAVQEKVGDKSKSKNWNHTAGFVFEVLKWNNIPKGICKLAVDAIEITGLHFGAVDIISKDGNFYVLEINTAPGLEEYMTDKYEKAFNYFRNNGLKPFEFNKKYVIREEEFELIPTVSP